MLRTLLLASTALLTACSLAPAPQEHTATPFTLDARGFEKLPHTPRDFANDPDEFQFAIIADNTGAPRLGVLRNALRKLNLLQPEFVVSVGDLIEGYSHSKSEIDQQWNEFNGFLEELDMRFFYTPGNHDWSNNAMAEEWEQRYGASTYHFVYKDTLFLVLNTEEDTPGGLRAGLTDNQVNYLSDVLDDHPDTRWTFLLMHQPLWAMPNAKGWSALETRLAERDYTAFAGHMHVYDYQKGADNRDRITLGTTGGYSLLRGKMNGEFDHVTWITMTRDGPKIANISVSGIDDKYVIPEDVRGAFRRAPAFTASPWLADIEGASESVILTVSNAFEYPLDYRFEVFSSPDIHLAGELPSSRLSPGETRTISLPVETTGRSDPSPLVVKAYADLVIEPGNTVSWDQTFRIAPVLREAFGKAVRPVVFDGKLDDWEALPFAGRSEGTYDNGQKSPHAPEDGSFRFGVQYDDTYLYVGVDVTDDEVASAELTDNHNARDFAVITLDARPAEESAGNPGQIAEMKHGAWHMIMAAPKGDEGEILFEDFVPEGFSAKVVRREGGYTAEYRIPISYIISRQGENWKDLRLNVAINDIDPTTRNRPPVLMSWQPEWGTAVLGSGWLQRADN